MLRSSGCVFCGGQGLSNEHAWPSWLSSVFGNDPATVHQLLDENGDVVRLRRAIPFDVKVRRVCKPCNHTWMNDLETTTRPILEILMHGQSTALTPDDQRGLARWITKTGMMLDFATHKPSIPSDNYHSLFSSGNPPPSTTVLLSSIADFLSPDLSYMKQDGPLMVTLRSSKGVVESDAPRRVACYLQTFKLGFLVAQLFWADLPSLVDYFAASELSDGHIRAWPDPVVETWPTTRISDFAAFRAFANRLFLLRTTIR